MIYLDATTDKLQLVTGSAATVDVQANFIDASSTTLAPSGGGNQNTAISTATTTDVLAAPASSTIRTLKQMTVRNKDASVTTDVTLVYDANGTDTQIHKETLLPGYCLIYIEGIGFFLIRPALNDNRLISAVEPSDAQRVFQSAQSSHSGTHTFVMISGTAYYVYVGRVTQDITVKFVECVMTSNAAGTVVVENGLFSTPSAPNKSAQTLTKIVATGTLDSMTAGATKVVRNTSSFAQAVAKGTHLWAAMRTAFGTTQPTLGGLGSDFAQGTILTTTGGGALTSLSTASGTLPTVGTAMNAPDLRVTLD